MGKLETSAKFERRRGYLQKAILASIGVAGILLVAMAAPNALQLLGKFGTGKRRFGDETRSALSRLARRGLITFEERGGKRYARITGSGRRALALEEQKAAVKAKRGGRWDKHYRMVIFDIPERRRGTRASLRNTMRESGFLCIQGSVWIYPYDCEDLIALLKADLHIGKDVLYTIVEKIENDLWIKKHFGL
ncbi:MAG: hypothetical protein AAB798_02465 [Patescibacteria group bacterium]